MKCFSVIMIILGLMFIVGSVTLTVLGYMVPAIQYSGYSLDKCKCISTSIENPSDYVGIAVMEYKTLFSKSIEVVSSNDRTIVSAYLSVNYPIDSMVSCYVSSDDIIIYRFNNTMFLIFISITGIVGISLIIVGVAFHMKNKKRNGYANISKAPIPL